MAEPPQQADAQSRSSRAPAPARGRRRSTATAARPRSTSSPSAASCASAVPWRTTWSSPTSRSPATTPSSTRRPTAAWRSATSARTTARTSTVSRSPRAARTLLGPTDIVGVGHSTFRIVGDRLEEFVDTGEVSFSARHLTVTVDGGKQILKDVSFGVPEKSLIAVIGPSGSGKSTLLKALTGYRPANQGDVLYDNRNLYKQFAELRQRIGLVPQDDILHKELTVKKALKYAAKLRFPADTTAAEREARIDEVLRELKLDIHKEKKVTSLSGGQRKRVSVALELLTKPSLIFLDEPTSGLDPGMDRDVMQLLRGLADDGRTVLVVTHSVAELAICDKLLVMAPGRRGRLLRPARGGTELLRLRHLGRRLLRLRELPRLRLGGTLEGLAALPDVRRGHRRRRPAVRTDAAACRR